MSKVLKKIILQELKKIIKEQGEDRYLVSAEFFVYGNSDGEAEREADEILKKIDDEYDNNPRKVDIKKIPFGKIGESVKNPVEISFNNKTYYIDGNVLDDEKAIKLFIFKDKDLSDPVKYRGKTLMVNKTNIFDKLKK